MRVSERGKKQEDRGLRSMQSGERRPRDGNLVKLKLLVDDGTRSRFDGNERNVM